jgi:methionyl-tRNA formyltransferase
MSRLRVILLSSSPTGTAAHHLPVLVESGCCEIVAVVQASGRPARRGAHLLRKFRKMLRIGVFGVLNGIRMRRWYAVPTPTLEELCAQHGLPFHHVDQLNSGRTQAIFRQAQADLGISLGNGYIGKSLFTIPRLGMINIHHELLPEFRNAQSVIWQLHQGSAKTGYTIHRITAQIDAGAMLHREELPILFEDDLEKTVRRTYKSLLDASAQGLVHVLSHFDQMNAQGRPATGGGHFTTPTLRQFLRIRRNFLRLRSRQGNVN